MRQHRRATSIVVVSIAVVLLVGVLLLAGLRQVTRCEDSASVGQSDCASSWVWQLW